MQRRTFLRWSAGLSASALINNFLVTRALAAIRIAPTIWSRNRPGDTDWPAPGKWADLRRQVQGNLIEVSPLFAPCVEQPDSSGCKDVVKNIRNPFYLGDQPGGTQISGWWNAWKPAPSVYAIAAKTTADVVAGVNFARENNLRLVVKGTGHSYQGTSNAADSLLIWTRAMKQVTVHEQFVPAGAAGLLAPVPAVTAESGAVWIDLYHAVTSVAGRYVQGGGCTDVGVAGLVQSGGFGSMSKRFGLACAGLLEAELVTADGRVLTVNAHSHPDLFWALKGGGGGSWGVVTKVTLRTYDLPEYFGAAWGKVKAKSDQAYHRLIAYFMDFYADHLGNPHWGEQVHFGPDNLMNLAMVCQGLDPAQARQDWQPFFDWIRASENDYTVVDELGAGAWKARGWWDIEGNDSMIPDLRPGSPQYYGWWKGDQAQVGAYIHGYDSLWMPASLLKLNQRRQLVDALFQSSRHKRMEMQFNKGLAGAPPEVLKAARDTATNPAVCEAFALVIIAGGEKPAYADQPDVGVDAASAQRDAQEIDLAMKALTKIVPNAGSYVSESNYFNSNWKQAFWGANYARLLGVKNKYDPDGLFFVHHGVGSDAWSADGFVRVQTT
ncbi:FAD/FMN-containing dehydrogenase [Oxalobacteraceae bacterium GrIS 2.11]